MRHCAAMEPFINLEEKIGKTVGCRRAPHPLSLVGDTKEDRRRWRQSFPMAPIPRGVFRFATHEEADQWILNAICRPRDPQTAS